MTESTEPLVLVARLTARQGKAGDLAEVLHTLVEPSRAEAGCLRYDLHRSHADPHEFVFLEAWTGEEALEAHFGTAHFRSAGERMKPLLAGPPELGRYARIA